MTEGELGNKLAYWLAALNCGLLTADDISLELDRLILSLGENTPTALVDLPWEAVKGEGSLQHALREGLWSLGRDWREPISPELYWTLRRAVGEKWEAGVWTMEETVGHFSLLSGLCGEVGDRALLRLCDAYELAVTEGVYGTVEQVVEEFLEVIHGEEGARSCEG